MAGKFLLRASILLLVLLSGAVYASQNDPYHSFLRPVQRGITTAELALKGAEHLKSIHWTTVESLINEIQKSKPGVVGFDVDDTVFFTSAGFTRGQREYSIGTKRFVENPEFWKKMNNGWDYFDIPKTVAIKLINAYQEHGDQIYFITARQKTSSENLTEIIKESFNIKNMHSVIFTGTKDKTSIIKKLGITTFYGDADEDIASAKAAGAEGIRIMRASSSTNLPMPFNGSLGEKVIVSSEY